MQDIGLFKAITAKMDYLSQRQSLFAQNIANSDTPGYRPLDLKETDFSRFLNTDPAHNNLEMTVTKTNAAHLDNAGNTQMVGKMPQKETYEVAPSGNAVIIEEQLLKAGQNVMDYNLMVNVYQKQVSMLRTALGTGR